MLTRQQKIEWCDKLIFWVLIAIPFLASFSSAFVDAGIGALIILFILKRALSGEKDFPIHPIFISFSLLIVIALLSFWNTVSVVASLQGVGKLLKYGLLLVIVFFEIRDVGHIQKIILTAILGLFLVSLDGIYQLIFGVDLLRQNYHDMSIGMIRLNATFPDTNLFAGYLVLFIPILISLVLYYAKGRLRTIGIVGIILALFCLVFTFCRSAALGLFLVLILMSLIRKDKVMFGLLLICVLVAPFAIPENIKNWSKTTNSWAEVFLGKDRPIIYETALNMIRHHPFVGVGVNTFSLNYQKYKLHDAIFDPSNENNPGAKWYAHNSYLHMSAETGVGYFLVFLSLIFVLLKEWTIFYCRTDHAFLKFCGLGIAMGLVAFLVHGLTETNLYNPKIATLFWFQVALLMAMMRLDKKNSAG